MARILRVIATLDPSCGGPIEGLRQTTRCHHQNGHETVVVTLDPPEANFLKSEHFTAVGLGIKKNCWAYSSKLSVWLDGNLAQFDAVIIHGLWLYPSWATVRAISRLKKKQTAQNGSFISKPKVFVFPHGMLDPWFQSWSRRPIKSLRNILYWRFFERFVVNNSDGILFTSEEEKRLARTTFGSYRPEKEIVVPYGTSSPPEIEPRMREAFFKLCPALPSTRPYLLYLSRIHEKKGVDLLIRAYGKIRRQQIEGQNYKLPDLVIAGPGFDTPYGKKLLSLADEMEIPISSPSRSVLPSSSLDASTGALIHFPGMLQGESKWGAFHGCEAFILPSHQENFGIVVAEALACGKPVMISNQVNIWREIKEEKVGWVENDSEEGTLALLQNWLTSPPPERTEMGNRARLMFSSHFDVQEAARALLQLVLNSPEAGNSSSSAEPKPLD